MGNMYLNIAILACYVIFMVFIIVGASFITNVLFNKEYDPSCVGLTDAGRLGFARMTIIVFWLVFIPLSAYPLLVLFGYL